MPEFKTSFVAEPLDYGAYGAQYDQMLRKRIEASAAEKKKEREDLRKAYDLDKAMQTDVPGVIDRYRPALQSVYDEWFDASQKAQLDPSAENLARTQAARQQYMQFKDVAVSASTVYGNTAADIRAGKMDDKLVYNRAETVEDMADWNSPLEFEMVNGRLMMNGAQGQAYWTQTEYFDPERGLNFIPAIKAKETEYMIAPYAETQAKRLENKLSSMIRDKTGRFKGANTKMVGDGVWDSYKNEMMKGSELAHSIAIEYHSFDQGVDRVGGEDVDAAYALYDPRNAVFTGDSPYGEKESITWDPDARRYSLEWKVKDNDIIKQVGDNETAQAIINQRNAVKHHFEGTATLAMEQLAEKFQLDPQTPPEDDIAQQAARIQGTPIAWDKYKKGAMSYNVAGSKNAFNIRIGETDERVTNFTMTPDGIIRSVSFNTEAITKKQASDVRSQIKDIQDRMKEMTGDEYSRARTRIDELQSELKAINAIPPEVVLYESETAEESRVRTQIPNIPGFEVVTQSMYNTPGDRLDAFRLNAKTTLGQQTQNSVPSQGTKSDPLGLGI